MRCLGYRCARWQRGRTRGGRRTAADASERSGEQVGEVAKCVGTAYSDLETREEIEQQGTARCPAAKQRAHRRRVAREDPGFIYPWAASDCAACPLRSQCTTAQAVSRVVTGWGCTLSRTYASRSVTPLPPPPIRRLAQPRPFRMGIIYDSERAAEPAARGHYSSVSGRGGVVSRMRAMFSGVSGIRGGIGFGGRPTGHLLLIGTTGRLRFFM